MPEGEVRTFNLRRDRLGSRGTVKKFGLGEPGSDDYREFEFYPEDVNAINVIDMTGIGVSQDSKPMWDFFRAALGDGFDDFHAYLTSPDFTIDAEELSDLMEWMRTEIDAVPTKRPSRATRGRSRTGRG